jgi:soluble lytic murein transglycosylase-like protein
MKLSFNLLYINPLLLLAGLATCASVMANDVETSISAQQNIENSATASTKTTIDKQDTKGSLKNPNSMLVAMAFKFKNTEGSPRDYAEVAANYCRAAKFGDADAQYALGWMYANGRGVPLDEKIAAQLFTMAAEQGHILAKESLTKISSASSPSTLLACLLPDPPAPVASSSDIETAQSEQKAISDKTAALFYSQGQILKLVNKLAPRYNIDTNLAMAFIAVESGFNAQATSPKNAQGLMQLIPETAKRFGVKNTYKAEDNIKGGLAYLRWLLAYFKGDVQLVAAAYNAGEAAVEKYKGVPPYAETQMYVKKIAKLYNNSTHPYQDNLVKTSPLLNLPNRRTM